MRTEARIVRNALWFSLQPLGMNVISLAATMYLSRQLGAVEWGRFNLCLAFVAMFGTLAHMGLRSLANRQMAQDREMAGTYLGRILPLCALLAVGAALLMIVATPLAGPGPLRGIIAIMAVSQIITTFAYALIGAFQACEDGRPASVAQFLGGGLLTLASVIVVAAGGGVPALAAAYLLGPLCTLFLLCRWCREKPFWPRLVWQPATFGPLLRQALPFFGIIVLAEMGNRVDVFVVSHLLDEATLGCYTAAMSMVDRTTVLVDGVATALLPALAVLGARGCGDMDAVAALVRKAVLWCLVLTLPVALLVSTFAPQVIGLIFGDHYATAAPIMAIAIWRLPLMAMALVAGHALFAGGRQETELRVSALATLLALAFLYPLVLCLGPIGGAVTGCLRFLIQILLGLPALTRLYPGLWSGGQFIRVGAALAFMSLPLALVPCLASNLLRLLLAPVAVSCYLIALDGLHVVSLPGLLSGALQRIRRRSGILMGETK